MDWLVAAGHQPVHSYRPDSDTVQASCLGDVASCDLYVLIVGHRYGFQPAEGNPEGLSITHLEGRQAGQAWHLAGRAGADQRPGQERCSSILVDP